MKILFSVVFVFLTGCASSHIEYVKTESHYTKEGYQNYPVAPHSNAGTFLFYARQVYNSFFLATPYPDYVLPGDAIDKELIQSRSPSSITWIGHSTFLIKLESKTILTDPYMTDIAGPNRLMGSRRYVAPAIDINALPPIDAIVVSHDHYDHLDKETVEAIPHKDHVSVFIPLGLKDFFVSIGYKKIYELDWNESEYLDGIRIQCLPAVHNSGRLGQSEKNSTLWSSWAISTGTQSLYFAGDTAYSPVIFKNIGTEYRKFDVAMVPIGAYEPRNILAVSHVNPEEAVKIAVDIGAKVVIGMHWGTVQMSDEPIYEPPKRFKRAAMASGFSEEDIWILKIGETRLWPTEQGITGAALINGAGSH